MSKTEGLSNCKTRSAIQGRITPKYYTQRHTPNLPKQNSNQLFFINSTQGAEIIIGSIFNAREIEL
jgi:hypothetical protein